MTKEISGKSTKTDILQAYEELLTRIEREKGSGSQNEESSKETEPVSKVLRHYSVDTIIKNLADSKLSVVKSLDSLEEQLIGEHKKLVEIQQVIESEKQKLETVYEIKTNVDSLAALLLAQREKKEEFEAEIKQERKAFEEEMAEKRLQW